MLQSNKLFEVIIYQLICADNTHMIDEITVQ